MKKLINDPSDVVRQMLEGLALQAPHIAILDDENVLVRQGISSLSERPVAIISGGGSGHEPAHGGYVGAGMLSAAVCGEVFTSPSTDAVLAAIRATAGAAEAISELGGAKPGDRTMLDALVPAANAFDDGLKSGDDVVKAWTAAESGAQDTAQMTPRVGRASYLGVRAVGSPDGGAVAVACWLKALQPYVSAG